MKKALLILLASTSLIACTKKDDVQPERYTPDTIMSADQLPSETKKPSKDDVPPKKHHMNEL